MGAPAVLFAALVVAGVNGAMDRTRRPRVAPMGLGALIAALALLLVLHRGLTAPGLYTTGVDQVAAELVTRYPAKAYALDFDLSQTPLGPSLFVLMHRDGRDICFANPELAATHTMPPEDLCSPGNDQGSGDAGDGGRRRCIRLGHRPDLRPDRPATVRATSFP